MFKKLIMCFLTLSLLVSAAGCNKSNTPQTSTVKPSTTANTETKDFTPTNKTIKVAMFIPWWESADTYQKILDDFKRKYPEYNLVVTQPATTIQQLVASIQAGTQPDVWMGGDPNTTQFATGAYQQLFQPLDDYLKYDKDYNFNNVDNKVLNLCKFIDGKYYAIPSTSSSFALAYNKDLFAKSGLDPEKPPTTWTEFYNDAKALTKMDSNGVPTQLGFNGNPDTWLFDTLRKQNVVSEDGLTSRYGEPWVLETHQWSDKFSQLYGGDKKLPKGVTFSIKNGNVGMAAENLNNLQDYSTSGINLGIALLPRPDDYSGQILPTNLWYYFSIPKGCANPDGGWLFAKYAVTDGEITSLQQDYSKDPSKLFPKYIAHTPTREKAYKLFMSSLDENTQKLIQQRDNLLKSDIYYMPYSPLQNRQVALGSKWSDKYDNGEVNLVDMYNGLNKEFQTELDQWKKDMINKGWQFPANGNPIPPVQK